MRVTTQKCIERLKSGIERTKKFGDHDKIVFHPYDYAWQYILYHTPIFTLRYYNQSGSFQAIDCTLNDGGYNSAVTNERLNALIKEFDLPVEKKDGDFWYQGEKLKRPTFNKHMSRVRIVRTNVLHEVKIYDNIENVFSDEGRLRFITKKQGTFELI